MYHHRHSYPDLPAIPEAEEADSAVGVGSPTETIPDDDNYYNGTEQRVEGEEEEYDVHDDDDGDDVVDEDDNHGKEDSVDDDASIAESLANNSCAFTLDNVGFDEESSVAGSLAGSHSIDGANNASTLAGKSGGSGVERGLLSSVGNNSDGNSSVFQTPPLRERYSAFTSKSEREQKLHRETCRTLGLPYNEDWLLDTNCSSSSSDVGSGSFLGSISASSGSADEIMERKRKIDKLWPWPTVRRSNKDTVVEESGTSFDEESNKISNSTGSSKSSNVNSSSMSSSKLEASIAKVSQVKSICTKNVMDALTAFNERIENVYDKAQSKQSSSHHVQQEDLGSIESSVQLPNLETDANRRSSYVQQCFRPAMWVNRFHESNFRSKMVVGASILLVILCVIIVPTAIGTSQPKEVTSSSWAKDSSVTATTSHSIPIDDKKTITAVASNSVVTATIPTETSTAVIAVTIPTESNTVAATGVVPTSTESSTVAHVVIPTASPVNNNIDLVDTSNNTSNGDTNIISNSTTNTISNSTTNSTITSTISSISNSTASSPTASASTSIANSTSNGNTNNTTNSAPSCIDVGGKFTNSKGKRRTCYWLSVRAAGEVYSTILDAECGGGSLKPSELGSSCQKTCRGYNGCSASQQSGGGGGGGDVYPGTNSTNSSIATSNGEPGGSNSTSLSPTKSFNSSAVDDVQSGQGGNSTSSATNSSNSSTIAGGVVSAKEDGDDDGAAHRFFIDTRGQARQCSFLNIRNHKRRSKRRNENCVIDSIRSTCPKYCSDYFMHNGTEVVVEDSGSNSSVTGTVVEGAARQQRTVKIDAKKDSMEFGDAMTALSGIGVHAEKNDDDKLSTKKVPEKEGVDQDDDTADQVVEGKGAEADTLATVSCLDNAGYYLNHHGRAVQCSWLIDGRDPTDESRRINNCGYGDGSVGGTNNALLPVATELGKMCRTTCGTCRV